MTFSENLAKYAELAVRTGVNIQKGQQLIVHAPIEAVELVRHVTEAAYKAGASTVTTLYSDDVAELSRYKLVDPEMLDISTNWLANGITEGFDNGAARLAILGRNPTLLKDIDPNLIARAGRARAKAYKNLMNSVTSSKSQWSIIAYATEEWAAQVFPEYVTPIAQNKEFAVEKLWNEIFSACRVTSEDPVKEWEIHNENLHKRAEIMNNRRFESLRYNSSTSNIVIGLAEGHCWEGGSGFAQNGVSFNANIPTEEIFTTPHRNKVNGWIKSTKPLLYRGTFINYIHAVFKDGKVVELTAESGQKVIIDMVNEDEGASHLGEIAIVPHSSPISKSDIIFKETLFDENASCHLAFGQSYTKCMSEIEGETKEEYLARGGNYSSVHTDWMVGSADLNIYGIKNGVEELIFENGEWII